jgi:DNA-binding response OmpR family regulator
MKKVYVIDDDEKLNSLLNQYLTKYEYLVYSEINPVVALDSFVKINPDIIILDLMMPEVDGFEVCRKIRTQSAVPIIMLTARSDVTDRIVGLEIGADDYLPKPFEPRELLARIQAVLRRGNQVDRSLDNTIAVDERTQRVTINSNIIELTTMEFYLFKYLFDNRGTIVTRNMIFDRLKGLDADSFDRSVDILVSRLRNKIGDDSKKPSIIKTVWGKGYRFIG